MMKKNLKKLMAVFMTSVTLCSTGCGAVTPDLPEEEYFIEASTWGNAMMDAYLKPYWSSSQIYNETATFVGEEGEATLIYTPETVYSVKNYTLDITYTEGVDYEIKGNKICRLKGGSMPYWEVDEYFLTEPNNAAAVIGVDPTKAEFDFKEPRYLYYGETDTITKKQIAVTYSHRESYDGKIPQRQADKLAAVLQKIEDKQDLNIMVYGDSVAVGCNASGTKRGGNVNPHMPDAYNIVKQFLEKRMGVKVNLQNEAVGGWRVSDCINGYPSRFQDKEIDLLILRIGGNDGSTDKAGFVFGLQQLLDMFFEDFPNACVILQTSELPNQQSTWTLNLNQVEDWTYQATEDYAYRGQIAVVPVQSVTNWIEGRGKRTRDWLANNINHGNDFIIRLYAQMILTAMFGEEVIA